MRQTPPSGVDATHTCECTTSLVFLTLVSIPTGSKHYLKHQPSVSNSDQLLWTQLQIYTWYINQAGDAEIPNVCFQLKTFTMNLDFQNKTPPALSPSINITSKCLCVCVREQFRQFKKRFEPNMRGSVWRPKITFYLTPCIILGRYWEIIFKQAAVIS